jgi:hypothetical protein
MTGRRRQRGGALLEFAMVLPFSVMLFLGIGDFGVFFWRQTQMEEVERLAVRRVDSAPAGYATADEKALAGFGRLLEEDVRRDSGFPHVTLTLSRHYTCPLASGGERELTDRPQLCANERVYLRIASDQAVSPLLQPLRWMGFPETAFSRHFVRIR